MPHPQPSARTAGFASALQLSTAEQTGPARVRQFTFAGLGRVDSSICPKARWRREGLRRRCTPPVGARVVALAGKEGIFDAPQAAAGRGCLALFVADEGAVAQARLLGARDAEGIAGTDSLGRCGTDHGQSADA